jgi:hypothetical protein
MERRDPFPDTSRAPGRDLAEGGVPLVRAAMRRRSAERAFEDYVREMARRWNLPTQGSSSGAGDVLPKV